MSPGDDESLRGSVAGIRLDITEIKGDVAEIKGNCKPCREEVGNHAKILAGRPGNSMSEGLVTRMKLVESNQKVFSEMRAEARKDSKQAQKASERNVKWFRVQLASVIAALLAFLAMAAKHFLAVH